MRRPIAALVAATTLPLLAPARASALFHLAHISEINVGTFENPAGAQYVEIEMEALLQRFVTNSILAAWDCDGTFLGELLVVPNDVLSAGAGVRWIMATTTPLGGITPDFGTVAAGIPTSCGQVCWGAPGLSVPAPDSWDHEEPNEYVDCVAYGGYTGPTRTGSGTPTPLAPDGGATASYSLTRVTDTDDNAADFALACATPENNAQLVGDVVDAACAPASTTSTTTVSTSTTIGSTTTSTTVPAGEEDLLPGKLLRLKAREGKPEKSALLVVSQKSAELTLGRGAESPDDPGENGGRLLVASSPGGGFLDVHVLEAAGWTEHFRKGALTGYSYRGSGAIRSVKVKGGKALMVRGKGAGLGHDLATEPAATAVVLETGAHRYCLEFGGTPKFKPGRSYTAKNASAPPACASVAP